MNEIVGDWAGSPPMVYHKLHQAMDDPEVSFADFADIISADPNLVARLLRIANSALYALDSKVETISDALRVVGIEQITEMALATQMVKQFKGIPRAMIDMQSFWMHSIACGLAARTIAKRLEESNLELFYIAGMLHDIGSLVLYKEQPELSMEILVRCRETHRSLLSVEQEILGFGHDEVGGLVFSKWDLPLNLIESVRYHHEPLSSSNFPLYASIVHVADIITYEMKLGTGGEPYVPKLETRAVRLVGLNRRFLTDIQDHVRLELEDTMKLFFDV